MKLANNLDTIPAPLLDRMEVLEVLGYVSEEKTVIASRYIGPQAKDASGLAVGAFSGGYPHQVIYCRESGVRNLRNILKKCVCL